MSKTFDKLDEIKYEQYLRECVKDEKEKKIAKSYSKKKKKALLEEWERKLAEEEIVGPRNFGWNPEEIELVELEEIGMIPKVLEHLKSELFRRNGLNRVGIFRNAGSTVLMKEYKKKMNKNEYVEINNCNDSATLIKIWFRELPTKLFDHFPGDFFNVIDKTMKESECLEMVEQLPDMQKRLTNWLMDLMMIIEESKDKNKMNSTNLAIVFSPNLYKQGGNPIMMMKKTSQMSQFFSTLLDAKIEEKLNRHRTIGFLLVDYTTKEGIEIPRDEYVQVLSDDDVRISDCIVVESGEECRIPLRHIELVQLSETRLLRKEAEELEIKKKIEEKESQIRKKKRLEEYRKKKAIETKKKEEKRRLWRQKRQKELEEEMKRKQELELEKERIRMEEERRQEKIRRQREREEEERRRIEEKKRQEEERRRKRNASKKKINIMDDDMMSISKAIRRRRLGKDGESSSEEEEEKEAVVVKKQVISSPILGGEIVERKKKKTTVTMPVAEKKKAVVEKKQKPVVRKKRSNKKRRVIEM